MSAIDQLAGDDVLAVVGPTASGKTALSVALAERFGGEVIVADSVQVYRRFDIGSGKPTAAERARVPHHLLDVADAKEPIDAARFAELGLAAIADVRARGLRPIVCGGTFLWVRALFLGLAEGAPKSEELREQHRAIAASEGRAAIHARLAAVDPEAAARLAPNDLIRTSRALEVFELTGKRLSELQAQHGFAKPRMPYRLVGIRRDDVDIRARIAARTREWLAHGWLDEVRALVADGYAETRPMGAIGYKQALAMLRGQLPERALAAEIDRATKVFVRRQRTWLRDEPVAWLEAESRALRATARRRAARRTSSAAARWQR